MLLKCRECGGPITIRNGRPVELNGGDHFDICAERRFDTIRRDGTYFKTENGGEGYIYKGKRIWTHLIGPVVTGKDYKPSDHDCASPSWEECRCFM